jgi:hypothetical protein
MTIRTTLYNAALAPLALAGALLMGNTAQAADTPAKPTAKAAAKPAPASPAAQARARSAERAKSLAEDTVEQVNAAQMDVAARVLTGVADCEFNQKVTVQPMEGREGHFHVLHNKMRYTMVPQETTTGAVRLEDKRAGVVWLQIPAKSMLMNMKIGQRMVDSCTLSEQRAAVKAVTEAIGIVAAPAAAPPATPAAPPAAAASAAQ